MITNYIHNRKEKLAYLNKVEKHLSLKIIKVKMNWKKSFVQNQGNQ
jgi:hypothetical protein